MAHHPRENPGSTTDSGPLFLGDELYPDLNDPEGTRDRSFEVSGTVENLRKQARNLHRYERQPGRKMKYLCNTVLPHGYRIPKVDYDDSKL